MNPTTITALPGTPFIDVVRDFDATPAQVFRASTDPGLVSRWLGPRDLEMQVVEYDVRPGGSYRYLHRDAGGNEYRFHGVFHNVVENEMVVQTFEFEGTPGSVSLESMTYEDFGGRTRLRTHAIFPSIEARDTAIASGMERGIVDSMERLEALIPATGRVVVDISMSLDGYVAAPGVDLTHGLGVGGEALHTWVIGGRTAADTEILDNTVAATGAVVMGRRTFDIVDGPDGWSDEMAYGAERGQADAPPVFVVTHSVPEKVRLGDRFVFVTDGLESTLAKARAVAGEKDVVIMGGGEVCHGFLAAGLVDVLTIHLAPVVLGGGSPLFAPGDEMRLELTDSVTTPGAEHLTYRVLKTGA